MRILFGALLALTVTAAAAEEAPDSKFDVEPNWVRRPRPDEFQAVWPRDALLKGRDGRVVIACEIAPQGTLEACKVISESPSGEGFGAAALLLAPSFAMKPGVKDGKPVRSTVRIPINFKTAGPASPLEVESVAFLQDPIWASAPTFEDMAAAWPEKAKGESGHVSMRCGFTREGTLRRCEVLTEMPRGQGFGKAARTVLASRFRLRMSPDAADRVSKAHVNLAVQFTNPSFQTPRAILQPRWITQLDPAKVQAIYPAKAADAGVKSGKGFADCAISADGHLVDCKPSGAAPDGLGFAEAAVQVASVMQMNPWTDGGGPVDGARIRLPVAFNLAPAPAPAKP